MDGVKRSFGAAAAAMVQEEQNRPWQEKEEGNEKIIIR
ncbi:hypothetical protein COLO4_25226 [Corchorus olitorius]|uniref:Uncharacterized protein n=1 Tax=Corchorus olitorius TaxID=93759 RepID=A0A1R3I438_9ROSI|nr:hypothetical protein COLO4_25226 [Corchorus olitorius]